MRLENLALYGTYVESRIQRVHTAYPIQFTVVRMYVCTSFTIQERVHCIPHTIHCGTYVCTSFTIQERVHCIPHTIHCGTYVCMYLIHNTGESTLHTPYNSLRLYVCMYLIHNTGESTLHTPYNSLRLYVCMYLIHNTGESTLHHIILWSREEDCC